MPSFQSLRLLPNLLPLLLLSTALLPATPVAAKAENYELDPVHTRVAFQISHAGFSNPIGSFSGTTGTLDFDEHDWTSARLTVRIPIATLNLGDAKWQEKILDRTFFDSKTFPEARFVSTRVEPTGENSAQVTGDLTLHGVTRPVTLKVTLNALKRHPLTFKKTVGFSATAILSRKEFGMDAWKALVGDEVHLIIEAEAMRGHENPDQHETLVQPAEPTDADAQ